jgi:hypothetical protein
MLDSAQGAKWRVKPNIQSLATLFDSCPGIDYKNFFTQIGKYIHLPNGVTLCMFLMVVFLKVFLPYASAGHFNLFSIDKHACTVSVIDP